MEISMDTYKITTDDTLRETLPHGTARYPFAYYPEKIWQFDFHRIDWHWHHEFEFLIAAESKICCLAGTDKIDLPKGCGIFINSGVLHRYEAYESACAPNIVFSASLLADETSLLYEKYIAPVISSSVPYQIFDPQTPWLYDILQLLRPAVNLGPCGFFCISGISYPDICSRLPARRRFPGRTTGRPGCRL